MLLKTNISVVMDLPDKQTFSSPNLYFQGIVAALWCNAVPLCMGNMEG